MIDPASAAPASPVRFSANLGFLWTDLPLVEAIGRAGAAGFDAVECHQPYAVDPGDIRRALDDADLTMISLNTEVGDRAAGEAGLAALPGREHDARELIDQAVLYAATVRCQFVSVLAGHSGRTDQAETTWRNNLLYAANVADSVGVSILIEPLSAAMGAGYHVQHVEAAAETVRAIGAENLHIMADTFHVLSVDGDLSPIEAHLDLIGHLQISGWPDRAEPDHGIDFHTWLPSLIERGYGGAFGAEYHPRDSVEAGLGWLNKWNRNTIDDR